MRTLITETGERGIVFESTDEANVCLRALATYAREMSKASGMEKAVYSDGGKYLMFSRRWEIAMDMYRVITPFDMIEPENRRQDIMDDHEDARNLCHANRHELRMVTE